jgi:NAD-dependent SIR2 family protein deacetylase
MNQNPCNAMVTKINRDLLKFAAGQQMFCPLCERILDAKTTVNVGRAGASKTVCATCYDGYLKPAIVAKGNNLLDRCDVLDGRVVFKRVRS